MATLNDELAKAVSKAEEVRRSLSYLIVRPLDTKHRRSPSRGRLVNGIRRGVILLLALEIRR